MARYIDLSDTGVASGNDGLTPTTRWNLNDILSGSSEDNTGETIFLKGLVKDLTVQPTKFRKSTEFRNFGDMNGFGIDQNDGNLTDDFFPITDIYTATRMILNFTHTNRGNSFKTCTFINNFDLTINENTNPGGAFVDFDGCTFNMNGNDIITQVGLAAALVDVTFNSCMFIDAVFNNGGGANCIITCNDCLFTSKSQAQVEAAFVGAGNTITFNNCDFLTTPLPQAFPTRCKDALGPDEKDSLYFDLFLYGPSHPTFPDSLMLGVGGPFTGFTKGLFGGERRGRGAFWFANTYYTDLSNRASIGTQDGMSAANALGIDDFLKFTDEFELISLRGFREGDKFQMFGKYLGYSDVTLRFPNYQQAVDPHMQYFTHFGYDPNYRQVVFDHEGILPVFINDAFQLVDFGAGNHFKEFIIRQGNLSNRLYNVYFTSCILIHETEITINYDFVEDSNNQFIGSTIITPIIRLRGNPTTAPAPSTIFDKCFLFGFTSPENHIQIILDETGTTFSGNDFLFYAESDVNFDANFFDFEGKVCIKGNVNFTEDCTNTIFRDVAAFLKADSGANEFTALGNYTFQAPTYFDQTLKNSPHTTLSDEVVKFEALSGFDTNADIDNQSTAEVRMDENTYFNGDFTGTIEDLNNKDFTHDGDLINPGLQITNFNSVIDNGGSIGIQAILGFDCSTTAMPGFVESAIPSDNIFLWSALKGSGSPASGWPGGDEDQLTGDFANGIWSYINGLGKLFNGFAVIRVDSLMRGRENFGLFTKKIIIINENIIEIMTSTSSFKGWYSTTGTSITFIYNTPSGTLTFGQERPGFARFYGYILNEGTATWGDDEDSGMLHIFGAIHDISGNTLNVTANSFHEGFFKYNSSIMNELSATGAVSGLGTIIVGVDHHVHLIDTGVWSTSPEFTTIPSIYLFITDGSSVYDVMPNTLFSILFVDYEDKLRINFLDYNDSSNLEIGAPLDVPGLFGSTRDQDAVGAWFFGGSPAVATQLYVDLELGTSGGDGSTGDPLNSDEIRSYYESSGILFPVNGDEVFVRGCEVADENQWWTMNLGINVEITITAWNLSLYGPYIIEMGPELSGLDVDFIFASNSGGSGNTWNIRDLVLTAPHSSIGKLTIAHIDAIGGVVIFGNTLFASNNDLVFADGSAPAIVCQNCTLSIGDGSDVISSDSVASDISLFDTMLNIDLNNEYLPGLSGSVFWTNCETTLEDAIVSEANPGITITDCTFDAVGISFIPTTFTKEVFDLNNFIFNNFNVNNPGNPGSWGTWGTPTGLGGNTRTGPGAFYFISTTRSLYYDFSQVGDGAGTQANPFNFPQYKNYFDQVAGNPAFIIPVDGDTLFVRGSTNILSTDFVFNIDRTVDGTVLVKAWDLNKYGIWIMDTVDNVSGSNIFSMFTNSNDNYIKDFIIQDFAMLENDSNGNLVFDTMLPYSISGTVDADTRVTIKNSMFYLKNALFFATGGSTNIELYMYGCTINTPSYFMVDGADIKDKRFFDCKIKALQFIQFAIP